MVLTLTKYLDAEATNVAQKLEGAVDHAIDAAATRIGATRADVATEGLTDGVRVNAGLNVLDGSELHIAGDDHLTTLTINVPWDVADNAKLLAAGAFAEAVASEVTLAA